MGVAVTIGTVGIEGGTISIDQITSNNRPVVVGSVSGISQSTLTTVATVPANGIKYITKIICSGEENARWEVYLDSVLKVTKRTINRQIDFDFNLPMKQLAAEVLDVKCIHFGPGTTSDFQCTVMGYTV